MSPREYSEVDMLTGAQRLWDVFVGILQKRGIDLNKMSAEWATRQAQRLATPDARTAFVELCKHGCTPQALAGTVELFRFAPHLERSWTEMVGKPDKRLKLARTLEKTAFLLEDGFREFIAMENETVRRGLSEFGRLPVTSVVSELRFYIDLLNSAKGLAVETETHSLQEFCRYLLASYVKQATGRFQDRNVSALLADGIGPLDYDEVAQRMWRSRNYPRLEKHFSKATDFLFALGVAIASRA